MSEEMHKVIDEILYIYRNNRLELYVEGTKIVNNFFFFINPWYRVKLKIIEGKILLILRFESDLLKLRSALNLQKLFVENENV